MKAWNVRIPEKLVQRIAVAAAATGQTIQEFAAKWLEYGVQQSSKEIKDIIKD
ncbi:MAG: hypothetical protein V1897_06975 [Pseudomonadota bacterium]